MNTSTLRGPGELLAALPYILGFIPVESIVVVGIRTGGELGAVMRVDRADCLVDDVLGPMARSLEAQLARDGAVSVVLVSYTDADVRVSCDAADALRAYVEPAVARIDAWAVTQGRYFAPGCADAACCPAAGTVVPQCLILGASAPSRVWRATGSHERSRSAWGSAPAPARRRCSRAADRWLSRRAANPESWRRESFERWRRVLTSGGVNALDLVGADLGKLIAGLSDVRVRDAVIVALIPGAIDVVPDVLDGVTSPRVASALDSVLDPRHGMPCGSPEAAAMKDALSQCVTHCRRKEAAPILTLHALVEWWTGEMEAALSLTTAAMESQPDYRLAGLVRATIVSGILPGWKA
jgi:hypothetical protein